MHSITDKDVYSLEIFETVLSAVYTQDSQVLKPPLLKELYLFFFYLSDLSRDWSKSRCSDYMGIKIQKFNYTVKFSDIFKISSFLFSELHRTFELCSVDEALAQSGQHLNSWVTQEDLILLLRCCMVTLHLLEAEPSILIEKCRYLLTILRKLCSPYISLEHSDSPFPFLCSVLEVFVDELLVHRQLRQYFMIVDDVSITNEKLFKQHLGGDDSGVVLEVIFILSVYDEYVRKKFLDASAWRYCKKAPCPELILTSAMQLLVSPVMVSAPCTFQAYLISKISRFIGIDMASDDHSVDEILKNHYISVLEVSFILYDRHVSCLKLFGHHLSANSGSISFCKPYVLGGGDCLESYVRPVTYNSVNQVANFADHHPNFSFKTKSEFVSATDAYIKENEQILDKFYKDEILSVLNFVVSQILFAKMEGHELHSGRDVSQQETYLLASTMNLMSNSLLQSIRCMRGKSLGFQKTMKDHSFCKEFDVIIGIIGCLRQHVDLGSMQKLLNEVGSNPTSDKASKLLIMHFAGLLVFCYDGGHEYLWKGCIFMMMTIMNLIIFEDGNLEALKELLIRWTISSTSHFTTKPSKVVSVRSSSFTIALEFQKLQKLQLRSWDVNAAEEDTCNNKSYLKLMKFKQSDIDDLGDFVVCKKDKDYPKWLKDRKKYNRMFVKPKMANLKRKRRQQARKFFKGMKT